MFKTGVPLGDAGSEPCRRKTYAKKIRIVPGFAACHKIRREGPGLRSGKVRIDVGGDGSDEWQTSGIILEWNDNDSSVGPVLGDAAHGRK